MKNNIPQEYQVIVYDIETTSRIIEVAEMIQLAVSFYKSKEDLENGVILDTCCYYFIPDGDSEPEAFEKHKITKDFLINNGQYLKDIYWQIQDIFLRATTLVTFSGIHFDNKIIENELKRKCGVVDTTIYRMLYKNKHHIDVYKNERKLNPFSMEEIYKRYFNEGIKDIHNASADILATARIYSKQVEINNKRNIEDVIMEERLIDPDSFFQIIKFADNQEYLIFSKGKYTNKRVYDLVSNKNAKEYQDFCNYVSWILNNNKIHFLTKTLLYNEIKRFVNRVE